MTDDISNAWLLATHSPLKDVQMSGSVIEGVPGLFNQTAAWSRLMSVRKIPL
jgi:hypothetical protein